MSNKKTGLDLLREPFPENLIGKLPKPTKSQTDSVRKDYRNGTRCAICGGWHHPEVIHLDYVGHAALTDRFLDVDQSWNWEPFATDEYGLPAYINGLLWIRLTLCGITRIGVGDAGNKQGGDGMKEAIGDALRNAGMRFGAALDLWHKGNLHAFNPNDYVVSMKDAMANDDALGFTELYEEMDENERNAVWKLLNTKEKKEARAMLYSDGKVEKEQVKEQS